MHSRNLVADISRFGDVEMMIDRSSTYSLRPLSVFWYNFNGRQLTDWLINLMQAHADDICSMAVCDTTSPESDELEFVGSETLTPEPLITVQIEPSHVPGLKNFMLLLATRKYQLEEIARWYGVPPWMIGSTEKSTSWGTGMEQQNLGFLTYTLSPYLIEYESAVYNQLLSPIQRAKGVYAEHSLEGLLRADSAGRASFYSTMTQNALMTRNEARAKENLPPKAGGDILTLQSNMIPLDKLGEVTNANNLKNALLDFLGEDSK